MPVIVVGISEMKISNSTEDILITYSLGSCIGVSMYDPVSKIGGMIHYMLPLSKISPGKAAVSPGMFADTGVTTLLKTVFGMGAAKDRLIIKAAGGSKLLDQNSVFNVGERNYLILRKIMWKNNILIKSTDVGGSISRTMRLEIATGNVSIKSGGSVTNL